MHSTLSYELSSTEISGRVNSDFMNVFTLVVDDNTPAMSAEEVIEYGNIQGKYSKGERWVISTERFYSFPGALYIVGVYNHGKCYTRPIYVNLPLNDCWKYVFDLTSRCCW